MAEWLILVLLVPAIVVPVVVVFGFAGCGYPPLPPLPPTIDATEGENFNTISVTWGSSSSPGSSVSFRRTNLDNTVTSLGERSASTFPDTVPTPTKSDQNPPLVYQYQAQYSLDADDPNSWSDRVPGKTFELTFDGKLNSPSDQANVEGYTLVQRIEPGFPLIKSSSKVQIIVQASSTSDAHVDRIYISQPDPSSQNRYDSLPTSDSQGGLTKVYDDKTHPVTVPAGSTYAFDPVSYTVDITQPLLLAVDFTAPDPTGVPTSGIGNGDPVDAMTKAAAYLFQYYRSPDPTQNVPPEAAKASRSAGYVQINDGDPGQSSVNFIASIYVFVG